MKLEQTCTSVGISIVTAALGLVILVGCASSTSPRGPSTGPGEEPTVQSTSTRGPNSLPAFKDIRASIIHIWQAAQDKLTPERIETVEARMKQRSDEGETVVNGLKGIQVQEW